ncbi:NAD(P)-dependent oxidoreductase [Streptomyces sp. NPDC051569]|uniref:NAD(P)-dependent oxidoreductase n=1 Tax=Streptomyces sp. NPDC051569 TaxID=3365661 RepID=UPI0037B95FDB
MADQLTVAVLGTGIMGAAMARNLCRTGHDVRVWNRTPAKAEALASDGARVAVTPAEAVTGADVVLTMLYDGPAALEAITAAGPGLRPGAIWLQTTTAGVEAIADLADFARRQGLAFVDAPVLGTKAPAESGQLLVLAAGPEEAREPLTSVLDAIGRRTIWLDENGATAAATRLKLVCNTWVLALTHGTGETLALAKGLGVDPQSFLDAMSGGAMDCDYLRAKATAILNDDYTPNFAVTTAAKDARLIVEAGAAEGVRMDLTEAGAERFRRAEAQGHGDEDMAATYFAGFAD